MSGKNVVHLLQVGGAVHHHLLVLLDLNGNAGQNALNESGPVKSLEKQKGDKSGVYDLGYDITTVLHGEDSQNIFRFLETFSLLTRKINGVDLIDQTQVREKGRGKNPTHIEAEGTLKFSHRHLVVENSDVLSLLHRSRGLNRKYKC